MSSTLNYHNLTACSRLSSTLWVTSIYLVIAAFNLVGVVLPEAGDFIWLSYKVIRVIKENIVQAVD
jgi:hypothetical protein